MYRKSRDIHHLFILNLLTLRGRAKAEAVSKTGQFK